MKLQLIRHATLLIDFNGMKVLVDPMLSAAGAMDPVQNASNQHRNPLVDLPDAVNLKDLQKADALLITHTHRDHFDAAAMESLPKSIPVFCQPEDQALIRSKGFNQVQVIEEEVEWNGIRLFRTSGKHGSGEMAQKMGPVSGFVMQSSHEPSLYITGDSIWCRDVQTALDTFKPDITVVFAGAAEFLTGGPITMTSEDIAEVCQSSPRTHVVAAHMEAWNHCYLTRNGLRQYIIERNLINQVSIPENGKTLEFV